MHYDPFRTAPTRFARRLPNPHAVEGPPRSHSRGWWFLIALAVALFLWGFA